MKKISYNDAAYILNYKYKHFFEKYCCYWFIKMNNGNEGYIECNVKPFTYGLLFLPLCLFYFFYCLWDGGIKEFEAPAFLIHHYTFCGLMNEDNKTTFGRLKEIWAR